MIPIPRISVRAAIEASVALLLLLALAIQTARIDGFEIWPVHVHGLKQQLADSKAQTKAVQAAFDQTVAGYRAAAAQAKAEDAANAARVRAEQTKINQESSNAYEDRIAAARASAERLRQQLASAGNSGLRSRAPVSGVSTAASGSAQASSEDGFSVSDRLTATEQAIQLDELIKWVNKQAGVDPNTAPAK